MANVSVSTIHQIARQEALRVGPEENQFDLTTTNATPTVIATITPADTTCGVLEVTLVGGKQTGTDVFGGRVAVVYIKEGGTVAIQAIETIITDCGNLAATTSWQVGVNFLTPGDLLVEVTGIAATTINWRAYTKLTSFQHIV
jgi:hypothetical protein